MFVLDLDILEYDTFHANYIKLAGNLSLLDALEHQRTKTISFFNAIAEEKMEFAYATGKWTIKEILQHVIDTERIFSYRALRFARNDTTNLPGYEQDDYVIPSKANKLSKQQLITDFDIVRKATISLYNSFFNEALLRKGTASNNIASVRALGFINVGHMNHHCNVIKELYL